jgi:hypothetical protein
MNVPENIFNTVIPSGEPLSKHGNAVYEINVDTDQKTGFLYTAYGQCMIQRAHDQILKEKHGLENTD